MKDPILSVPGADFFDRDVVSVARDLIGARLVVAGVGGVIVETEAYDGEDAASHSYRGPTRANAAMFAAPGTVYVYRSYGIHWCFNLVCRPASAVLIRALEPVEGIELMAARRDTTKARALCSGPGKLCQALAISGAMTGLPVTGQPFQLTRAEGEEAIVAGPRIGISRAIETPWRFGRANSPYLSRSF